MGCSDSKDAASEGTSVHCALLVDGELKRGEFTDSVGGRFRLIHQNDGNVVIYKAGEPVWATDTCGKDTTRLVFQKDGNLVLYNEGDPLWASDTCEKGGDRLIMQVDGNLVMYNAEASPVWASNTSEEYQGNCLKADEQLAKNETRLSTNSEYLLAHQADGNVVLYVAKSGKPLWSTNTAGKETEKFVMQGDGNLVLYAGEPAWASDTCNSGADRVVVQDDGNLVVLAGEEKKWASETAQEAKQGGGGGAAAAEEEKKEEEKPAEEEKKEEEKPAEEEAKPAEEAPAAEEEKPAEEEAAPAAEE